MVKVDCVYSAVLPMITVHHFALPVRLVQLVQLVRLVRLVAASGNSDQISILFLIIIFRHKQDAGVIHYLGNHDVVC